MAFFQQSSPRRCLLARIKTYSLVFCAGVLDREVRVEAAVPERLKLALVQVEALMAGPLATRLTLIHEEGRTSRCPRVLTGERG